MGYLIGLMTVFLALDCVVLILLILMQLPKKEAGMGTAFGGAATDALFGAGSGNVLTNLTRYAATIFFALALVMTVLNAKRSFQEKSRLKDVLKQQAAIPAAAAAPTSGTNNILETPLKAAVTNLAASVRTNVQAATTAAVKPEETTKPAATNLLLTTTNITAEPKK